ncbi:hypothetical protein SAMN05216466_101199 [Paraburkholderia phenazinium]|uniref:Uncharacterized protein n=2 Tax=Paraburkholderia phenazinium TaxID=60549 RepID=A0A1G7P8R5_9BURK|nr:hypothetical protein SAMN05216466_101199 [Paraburkholderia phenazinium]
MNLRGEGFLNPAINDWIKDNKEENCALFDHAARLRDLALELARETSGAATSDQELTLTALLLRAISSFEGVILLSERGMFVEARTIARNVFETAFYMGALAEDPGFVERMVSLGAR